jgi:hypothetical protein
MHHRHHRRRSFLVLHVACAIVTLPIWIVPFVRALAQRPPERWS